MTGIDIKNIKFCDLLTMVTSKENMIQKPTPVINNTITIDHKTNDVDIDKIAEQINKCISIIKRREITND